MPDTVEGGEKVSLASVLVEGGLALVCLCQSLLKQRLVGHIFWLPRNLYTAGRYGRLQYRRLSKESMLGYKYLGIHYKR